MSQLRPAILLLLLLTLVTGVVYPFLTTSLAQWLFPAQAVRSRGLCQPLRCWRRMAWCADPR